GLRQEPVQADDRHAGVLGLSPQCSPLVRRNVGDEGAEREGGHLQAGIAVVRGGGADAGVLPADERLVADGVAHGQGRVRMRPARVVASCRNRSSYSRTCRPLIFRIRSPGCSRAREAGELGMTVVTNTPPRACRSLRGSVVTPRNPYSTSSPRSSTSTIRRTA